MRGNQRREVELEGSQRKQQDNSPVVSALINLVCPDCGCAMFDFRCLHLLSSS